MFRRVKVTAAVAAALAAAIGCAILAFSAARSSTEAAIAIAAVAVLSAARPILAVLAAAALIPVVTTAMTLGLQRPGVWSEALLASLLAGWFVRVAARRDAIRAASVAAAAAVFATITLTSMAVELAEWRARLSPDAFWPALASALSHYHTDRGGMAAVVRTAARLVLGVALALMVGTVCRTSEDRRRVLRMAAVGAAAAAAFNVNRLLAGALRSETPWPTLLSLMRTVRVSLPYGDVNAAGSYFALTTIVVLGLAWTSARGRAGRALWSVVIAINLIGLWLSQSRTAVLAMALMLVSLALLRARRAGTAVLAAIVVLTALMVWIFPNPILDRSSIGAVGIRAELARVAWRLTATAPVFGIGIGQFFDQSGQYIQDPYVRSIYPNENAHNNFLQILAELGVVGLIAFVWLLAEILVGGFFRPKAEATGENVASATAPGFVAPAFRWKNLDNNDHILTATVLIALVTFLLTCAGGHPLLIEEVAFTFWCVAGILLSGAIATTTVSAPGIALRRRIAVTSIAVLLAVMPWRLGSAAESIDLEHVGYGVSSWLREDDGTRYRRTSGDATLFVQSNVRAVDIPLRLLSGSEPITVEIVFRNRVADRVVVAAPSWQVYRLLITPGRSEARYLPVRLRVISGDPQNLAIGRTVPR